MVPLHSAANKNRYKLVLCLVGEGVHIDIQDPKKVYYIYATGIADLTFGHT